MDNLQKLSKPNEINSGIHKDIFDILCGFLSEVRKAHPEFLRIRIRDWDFVFENGLPTLQIFLSREKHNNETTSVSLDDCACFHRWLLEKNALDMFDDSIAVEVSSEGVEPSLRMEHDFKETLGKNIVLETWEKKYGKTKFAGILQKIENKSCDSFVITLDSDKGCVDFLSSEISRAKQIISFSDKKKRKDKTIASQQRDK